jgi:hypothetical protein
MTPLPCLCLFLGFGWGAFSFSPLRSPFSSARSVLSASPHTPPSCVRTRFSRVSCRRARRASTVRFLNWDTTVLKTQQVEHGTAASAPDVPTRDGYRFLGWDNTFTSVIADLDVTAQYEKLTYYTVTFKGWDSTVLKTESVVKGGDATAPTVPTRDGYKFKSWSPAVLTGIKADTIFTAQYEKIIVYHTVSFSDDDSYWYEEVTVEDGKAALAPLPLTKDGYSFDHWDTDFSNVNEDLSVTAVFRAALGHTVILIYSASGTLLQTMLLLTEILYGVRLKSFTTIAEPVISNKISINATGATNVGQTDAQLNGTCAYSGTRPTAVGIYFGSTSSSMNKIASDTINHTKNPFDIWYTLSKYGVTLNAGGNDVLLQTICDSERQRDTEQSGKFYNCCGNAGKRCFHQCDWSN